MSSLRSFAVKLPASYWVRLIFFFMLCVHVCRHIHISPHPWNRFEIDRVAQTERDSDATGQYKVLFCVPECIHLTSSIVQ